MATFSGNRPASKATNLALCLFPAVLPLLMAPEAVAAGQMSFKVTQSKIESGVRDLTGDVIKPRNGRISLALSLEVYSKGKTSIRCRDFYIQYQASGRVQKSPCSAVGNTLMNIAFGGETTWYPGKSMEMAMTPGQGGYIPVGLLFTPHRGTREVVLYHRGKAVSQPISLQ